MINKTKTLFSQRRRFYFYYIIIVTIGNISFTARSAKLTGENENYTLGTHFKNALEGHSHTLEYNIIENKLNSLF